MKMTKQQRNYIVEQIAETINNDTSCDSYDTDSISICYNREQKIYYILHNDTMTWDYVSPDNLMIYLCTLSDEVLIEFVEDYEGIETEEEWKDYFNELKVA